MRSHEQPKVTLGRSSTPFLDLRERQTDSFTPCYPLAMASGSPKYLTSTPPHPMAAAPVGPEEPPLDGAEVPASARRVPPQALDGRCSQHRSVDERKTNASRGKTAH